MANLTICRVEAERYSVVTDVVLANGAMEADYFMRLCSNMLVPIIQKGLIRVGRTIKIKLGPMSYAQVLALNIGDNVTI